MSVLDAFPGTRVVAVGDLMLDEYVWGDVRRISPEAPVPVVDVRERTSAPGGVANVAAGVLALDAHAAVGGVVGADDQGERLVALLADRGADCRGVVIDRSRPTTTKTRVIAQGQQVVRTDVEEREPLGGEAEERLLAWVAGVIGDADVVVISDYAKGVVSARVARAVIDAARSAGKPIVVDPKGSDFGKYAGATVLTPNVRDAKRAANHDADSYLEVRELGRRLGQLVGGSSLLITRGAEGMTLVDGDQLFGIATKAREVHDVTGAGDTVVAALAVALGCGVPLRDAARVANAAAGIVVGKVGTSTVTLGELRSAIDSDVRTQ